MLGRQIRTHHRKPKVRGHLGVTLSKNKQTKNNPAHIAHVKGIRTYLLGNVKMYILNIFPFASPSLCKSAKTGNTSFNAEKEKPFLQFFDRPQ